MALTDYEYKSLSYRANLIRQSIIEMLVKSGSGHTASPLALADIFTVLYFKILSHDPRNPSWIHRDRVIVSNGHVAPILYATLAHAGYFKIEELYTLRQFGSRLQGHPHRTSLPGVETSSGPLGSGLSQAIGMALVMRNNKPVTKKYIYVTMGDGELNEGNVWEAFMLLARERLTNIICIIDRNGIQIDGNTEDIMPLESLTAKLSAFNFNVLEIDGHNINSINDAFNMAKANTLAPSIIVAHTIPSYGVTPWQGDYHWHGKTPNKEEGEMALKLLKESYNKI